MSTTLTAGDIIKFPTLGKFYVYSLNDPHLKIVCYIGRTNDPYKRLSQHLSSDSKSNNKNLREWIEYLKDEGHTPYLEVIAVCDTYKDAVTIENKLIRTHSQFGIFNLPTQPLYASKSQVKDSNIFLELLKNLSLLRRATEL